MSRMTIPEVRKRLHELAEELACPELHSLADATIRTYGGRRAPPEAADIDANMILAVRAIARARPATPFRRIGAALDIDGGRVSEILAGKHDDKLRDLGSYAA